MLKPLAAAALLCTGAVYAAPPATNVLNGTLAGLRGSTSGLNSVMQSNTRSSILDLNLTLGSTTNSLTGLGASSLPGLGQGAGNNDGDNPLNLFSQNSPLHDNPVGQAVFDTANDVRRATTPPGLIPLNADRPDLPGLRKDATSRLVHSLKLYENSEAVLDSLPIGGSATPNLPLTAAAPALKQPIQEAQEAADEANDDGDDNGFLGVNNSSTLGTDDGSDNDSGFLGAGDSSTLGTDNDRDPGDNGFLGAANSSTLGTADN
ncbi:MAG TPA: hypothetical protein VJM31_15200 [Vicinamibacterales bacterium]|nr:hypothetical protein [Vicinamibacterales bacterium]